MASRPRVSVWVKLFVAFHVIGISVWCLPDPRPPLQQGTVEPYGTDWILFYNWKYLKTWRPFRFYMNTAGVWQYWDMFAPNPSSTDLWGDAVVTYRDGTEKRYPYYRMYDMPIPVKYYRERFRKFFERAGIEMYRFLWEPFARRVALEMDTMPGNPPTRIRLRRHWQDVPPPGKKMPVNYESLTYYVYEVDQAALAKAEGK